MAINSKKDSNPVSVKYDKYLTDIKELPDYHMIEDKKNKQSKTEEISQNQPEKNTGNVKAKSSENTTKKPDKTDSSTSILGKEKVVDPKSVDIEEKPPKEKKDRPFTFKDIMLAVINLISIILLLIILNKVANKSIELKNLRNETLQKEQNPQDNLVLTDANKEKVDKLKAVFLDEVGVVAFVNDVESIKNIEGTSIVKVSFPSQKVVKDKTGNFGYPVSIEFKGSWDQISNDLEKIEKLPYFFRTVRFSTDYIEEEEIYTLRYGLVLYVEDSENKNR